MMLLGHKAKSRLFMCLCENCSTITKLQIREKKTIKITKLSKYNEGYNKNSQQTITPCGKFKWREQIRWTLQFKISTSALKCANKACLNLFTSGLMANSAKWSAPARYPLSNDPTGRVSTCIRIFLDDPSWFFTLTLRYSNRRISVRYDQSL